jgi:hypothetical protein
MRSTQGAATCTLVDQVHSFLPRVTANSPYALPLALRSYGDENRFIKETNELSPWDDYLQATHSISTISPSALPRDSTRSPLHSLFFLKNFCFRDFRSLILYSKAKQSENQAVSLFRYAQSKFERTRWTCKLRSHGVRTDLNDPFSHSIVWRRQAIEFLQ